TAWLPGPVRRIHARGAFWVAYCRLDNSRAGEVYMPPTGIMIVCGIPAHPAAAALIQRFIGHHLLGGAGHLPWREGHGLHGALTGLARIAVVVAPERPVEHFIAGAVPGSHERGYRAVMQHRRAVIVRACWRGSELLKLLIPGDVMVAGVAPELVLWPLWCLVAAGRE